MLDRVADHPNRGFFILKTIVVNNLYGVDIMEEAVEICKLRLFLKLVAQVENLAQLEPLPDIDFNIRAGNALVGFTRYSEVETALAQSLDIGGSSTTLRQHAEALDTLLADFQQHQTQEDPTTPARASSRTGCATP